MSDDREIVSGQPAAPGPTGGGGEAGRLMSLDALRGFDMFWIAGAEGIVHALHKISDSGPIRLMAEQLDHAAWAGFTFYDLIFPLFVFIVGISVVLSLPKVIEKHGVRGAVRRILVRGLLIFVVGLIYSGGVRDGWANVRIFNVLQRIALCYTATALLYCFLRARPRALVGVCAGILLGYWALVTFTPVRDISLERAQLSAMEASTGKSAEQLFYGTNTWITHAYDDGRNLTHHLDFQVLPGRKYDGAYDPEGLLSTIPSVATCLMGVFAGLLLRRKDLSHKKKVQWLLAGGVACLIVGFGWGLQFPVIKKIWTSSFVLVAAGWSALLLALFYQVIDVWNYRRWATPFVWIGMNPITIYLAEKFFDFKAVAERIVGGPIKAGFGVFGQLLVTMVSLGLLMTLAWFLHKKRIFLRL